MTYPPQPPPEWNQPSGSPFGSNDPFGQTPQWPNYGQQPPTWSGYGEAPPADAPPPKRNNTGWIIGTVAGVVVVALLLGGVLWKLNYGDKNDTKNTATTTTSSVAKAAPSTTKAAPSSAAPAAPPKAAPAGCDGRTATAGPQTPAGWSTVTTTRGLAYDVPADWTVEECSTGVGWEKPCPDGPFGYCPVRLLKGAATMPNRQCPKGSSAITGVASITDVTDVNESATLEAKLATKIFTSDKGVVPSVSVGAPRSLTVSGAPAAQVVATVTGIQDDCTGSSALYSVVSTTVPGQSGTVNLIIELEQGFAGAADPGVVDQIAGTLRRID
ncbi:MULTISPECIES: hypothetical protein [unclassified Mycolicibacterium]|uniref:hypothetical protein n=1 Tax=unclassified Mycolicibacterium TaxID=2636767 RepID=UPI0012DF2341|nr:MULTISPECIES: hypothetical protein [unclassified Mycolicibacterium]MUL85857.1 hypothetical protein [Mycolicibacterium sp. CBMA 329]MUL90227.1 hypothetical protein [Mycolicibacterium sp. CBMA 331]MUM00996.1 hypothetical protein [Mycolicibacterium sp. CBMA 334]MUM27132.1 hypothetical protein [Mycolicibacterium sp. CBMA 295]MUM39742.1 hypothetical protein [Mycolicibacterium sp. CBMA 247]